MPPFGSGATLYVRPFMVATGEVIGVGAAPTSTQFRILVTPVGPYYSGGVQAPSSGAGAPSTIAPPRTAPATSRRA